ncbi:hypothetical protein L6250_01075 [Candidatus Parcubacteria bacterium]|nr:hypothetical protein [Patescibacteria group bacterium]MBU4466533.1 hypothetical protein [Patescibacteria group bacterium]MCG2688213.1 hypothetical protein [Candidatus Parcubacteria bacterium]
MMKSSFYVLLLGILIVSLVLPVIASAQIECCRLTKAIIMKEGAIDVTYPAGSVVGAANGTCPLTEGTISTTDKWGVICFLNMMNIVINWIFLALMILVIILVLFGAFNLMTAAGDTVKVKKGRDMIMYASIGLVVALIARAVPSIVRSIFG